MPETILVPIDLSHVGAKVLDTARELAELHDAKMIVMTVLPIVPAIVSVYLPSYEPQEVENESIDAMKSRLKEKGMDVNGYEFVARHGVPYDEIIKYADEIKADLIVVGSHSPTVSDYLLGSTAAKIVRHANCSVHVVRNRKS